MSILVIGLLALSAVSASDDIAGDNVTVVDDEDVSVESTDDIESTDEKESSFEKTSVKEDVDDDEILSSVVDDDVLGASPPSSAYKVSISDITMNFHSVKDVPITITSASSTYDYRYDFYFSIYDADGKRVVHQRFYSSTASRTVYFNIWSDTLKDPGIYTIKIENNADNNVMSTAKLTLDSVPYSKYKVSVSDVTMDYGSSGSIKMTITPSTSSTYYYKYDFYLRIYDSKNVKKVEQRYYSSSSTRSATYQIYANSLNPGEYTVKIVNYMDNRVMSSAKLTVKSPTSYDAYSVNVEDTPLNYGTGGSIKMSITPASSSYIYAHDFYMKVFDSNNNEEISKRFYSTYQQSSVSFTVNPNRLNPGTYTIKIYNNYDNKLMDTAFLTINEVKIESNDAIGSCDEIIKYKVRISEANSYKSGLNVIFTCNGKTYSSTTDNDGYATLSIHLKSGTYEIKTVYTGLIKFNTLTVNEKYLSNDYRNLYLKSSSAFYGQKNKFITYGFEGYLKGYLKIYKGGSLKNTQKIDTSAKINDYPNYKKHSFRYSIKNLNQIGTYTAKIVNAQGKVLASSAFKITKAPSRAYTYSFTTLGGFKETVDAYALDEKGNRNDMGGTAKFKINDKTYKAKVKNGYAKVKVKFSKKKKTYKCSVKFLGDKNHKSSNTKFKIKVTTLKNPIKLGKYKIKLTGKQYNAISKSIKKCNSKTFNIKTKYQHAFKKPYYKQVKKYRTTTSVKTLYAGSYLPTMNKMWDNGWSKVSEYTYVKKNQHPGYGLSAYTIAVTKWVKVYYKKAYTTKYYPVKAKIKTGYNWMEKPTIKLYANGKTLKNGKLSFR